MTGEFTNEIDPTKVYNQSLWFNQWYYCHVHDKLENHALNTDKDGVFVEYIPVKDYIFRHNRAVFWTLRDQLPERIGNHVLFRYLLGWLCPP